MIRIMIAEDQELIRQSLEIMLSGKSDLEIVGAACNGREAVELASKLLPDVILMDIRMPELNGVRCIEIIKDKFPQIKIIVLTTFDDDEYVFDALKNGASGYLLKGMSLNELIDAIKTVVKGGALINPDIASKVVRLFSQMAQADYRIKMEESALEQLNSNERKIIRMIGIGMSNKEITYKLQLSEGTVRNYISCILSKLSLRDRTQIAIYAVQAGLTLKNPDDVGDKFEKI
jgi:DNA-binding NarL/FixJ family response regulator